MNAKSQEALHKAAGKIGIITTSLDGTIVVFNHGAEQMLGYSASEVLNTLSPLNFFQQKELLAAKERLKNLPDPSITGMDIIKALAQSGSSNTGNWHLLNKDGDPISVELSIAELKNDKGQATGYIFTAIGFADSLRLKTIADLPDKSIATKVLDREVRRCTRSGHPLAFLLIGIDEFDAYQQHYDFMAVEQTILRVGQTLHQRVQRASDLLAYLGGHQFATVLPDTDKNGAIKLAEYLRLMIDGLKIEHPTGKHGNTLTTSIAVAMTTPGVDISCEDLISKANDTLKALQAERGNATRVTE